MLIGCGIGILSYVVIIISNSMLFLFFLNEFSLNFVVSEQVPVYISEITPKNLRGGFATVNQVFSVLKGK